LVCVLAWVRIRVVECWSNRNVAVVSISSSCMERPWDKLCSCAKLL